MKIERITPFPIDRCLLVRVAASDRASRPPDLGGAFFRSAREVGMPTHPLVIVGAGSTRACESPLRSSCVDE